MSKMKKIKKELSDYFVQMYDSWHNDRSDFYSELLLLFLSFALAGLLGSLVVMIVYGVISAFIAKPIIMLIVLGAIAVIAAIPVSIVFLGKHIKANQE